MDLSFSYSLVELPDLSTAVNLCELILSYCSSLMEIPSSIGNATNLRTLDLVYCSSLVELPISIGNAVNLNYMNLSYCSNLVNLPSSIGEVICLQTLDLSYCSSLVEFPSSVWNAVWNLNLSHCSRLVELPSFIGNTICLRVLNLSHCLSLLELPSSIGNAIHLQDLDLSWGSSLVKLASSFGNLINLRKLNLSYCYSLVELPSSIGNIINLGELNLFHCSRLVGLPSSIGNARDLQMLDMRHCSSLMELPSSIGNLISLERSNIEYCSSLVVLPFSIGIAINLVQKLDFSYCSSLVELPSCIGNAVNLKILNLNNCSSLTKLPSSIGNATYLHNLKLNYCSSLEELPNSMKNLHRLRVLYLEGCPKLEVCLTNINLESLEELDLSECSLVNIEDLKPSGTPLKEVPSSMIRSSCETQELGPWIGRISRLRKLILSGMQKLVSLPQLPYSIEELVASNCESLKRLDCSFRNPDICLEFGMCYKLNQEARDLIIQTSTNEYAVLPGGEVPACFTYRASGNSVTVKLDEKPFGISTRFKACFILGDVCRNGEDEEVYCSITSKQNDVTSFTLGIHPFPEHMYIFEFEAEEEVTSTELLFKFEPIYCNRGCTEDTWKIKECGVMQLLEVPSCDDHYKRFRDVDEDSDSDSDTERQISKHKLRRKAYGERLHRDEEGQKKITRAR